MLKINRSPLGERFILLMSPIKMQTCFCSILCFCHDSLAASSVWKCLLIFSERTMLRSSAAAFSSGRTVHVTWTERCLLSGRAEYGTRDDFKYQTLLIFLHPRFAKNEKRQSLGNRDELTFWNRPKQDRLKNRIWNIFKKFLGMLSG